jgi:hypothetical protein
MLRIVLLIGLVVSLATVHGQDLEWIVPVDLHFPPNGDFSSTAMAVSPDGLVAIAGIQSDPYFYGSELFGNVGIKMIDAAGEMTAASTFTGKGYVQELVAHDGAFFAIGRFLDSLQLPGQAQLIVTGEPNNIGAFVCRVEASGPVTWLHDLHDFDVEGDASAMTIDENGVLYIAAWDFINAAIIRVDGDGALLERWELDGVGLVSDIAVNTNGMVAIAGSCLSEEVDFNGTIVTAFNDYSTFTARFSPNGILQDHLIIRDVTCPSPSVVLDGSNNSYFSADAFIETEAGPFTIQDPPWVFGEFILRIDEAGDVMWLAQPVHGESLGDASRASGTDLILHPDGGIMQGGFTRGNMDWGNGVVTNSTIPGNSLYFWQLDELGNTVQVVTGDEADFAQSVHSLGWAGDEALFVLGTGYDTLHLGGMEMPAQGHHLYLSRWSALGTSVNDHVDGRPLAVFPNPTTGELTVDLSMFSGMVDLEVLDALGRVVLTQSRLASPTAGVDLSELRQATYLVRARQEGKVLHRLLVKQ